MKEKARRYCCFRFRESVIVDKTIIKASGYDETQWYLREGGHIYYCPFCGQRIKGKGFGTYAQAALTILEMKALKRRTASEAQDMKRPGLRKKGMHNKACSRRSRLHIGPLRNILR